MKRLFLLCVTLLSTAANAAEPIFVPDFTPATGNEFAVAVMIQGMVVDRMGADGHIALTSDVVSPTVGEALVTNCASNPACPGQVLPKIPSRIAVVVRIQRTGPDLVGHLELFEQSNPNPVVVRDLVLQPGNEGVLADEVSAATNWLISQVGPSSDAVLMAAARMIAGQSPSSAPPPAPVPVPVPQPVPVPTPAPMPAPVPVVPAPPAPPPRPVPVEPKLGEETGVYPRHVLGSEQHYEASELDPRDWVFQAMPHAGRVFFEVRAGLAIGDEDRRADIRVELVNQANELGQSWYQEGPIPARRPRGSLYFGYAPYTFLDIGILGGLQYGRRQFTTGFYRTETGKNTTSELREVDAVQLFVQPRLRGYLVPVGPAKPYLFAGADIRIFDEYSVQQPPNWNYQLPPGGSIPGFVGGGGLMIDPSPIVGFLFEANYTQHFGPRAEVTSTGEWTYQSIPWEPGVMYTIGLIGGIQFRF